MSVMDVVHLQISMCNVTATVLARNKDML
uniref:Uncharacterized protein n=1 Tax=Arundo donax TaxID=35708 RepID=A0A0A9GQ05_ARUDO